MWIFTSTIHEHYMQTVTVKYNRIKQVLIAKEKSETELAAHFKVTMNTVSRWCTNVNQPSVQVLFEMAQYLEVDVRELLNPAALEATKGKKKK